MVHIKPKFDGKGQSTPAGVYSGPPLVPGTYLGIVKRIGVGKIKSGDNAGEPRINLLLEVSEGKYKGAGVFDGLNQTQQGAGFINAFLHALTDGSEKQKSAIEKAFWDTGYDIGDIDDKAVGKPILRIGKNFKPEGKPVAFVVKIEPDNNGNDRPRVGRFVIPLPDNETEDVLTDTDADAETDDGAVLAGEDDFDTVDDAEDENPWDDE